jgi:hypothetical protein
MSIRRTIILLTVPLFLALALVNGALLYFQEQAEMSQALREQALATAISSAEFILAMERPLDELRDPLQAKALAGAARQIVGLDGLYLAIPGSPPHALVPSTRRWSLERYERPAAARAYSVSADAAGQRHVVALAPAAGGAFVAARIDAEPMFAQLATIRRAILLIVLAAGLTATGLAWLVARRIVRELESNRQAIAAIGAGEPLPNDSGLKIREARDLADAVGLMAASRKAAAERNRRVAARNDRERTIETALAARRASLFPPLSLTIGGTELALRICGKAPLGSFFALCSDRDRAMVVLGRCSAASPGDELAQAVAARHFLETNMFALPPDECLAQAKSAHGIDEIRTIEWTFSQAKPPGVRLLALADAETASRAANYADRNRDAAPAALLDGIELLLEPDGVFAAAAG